MKSLPHICVKIRVKQHQTRTFSWSLSKTRLTSSQRQDVDVHLNIWSSHCQKQSNQCANELSVVFSHHCARNNQSRRLVVSSICPSLSHGQNVSGPTSSNVRKHSFGLNKELARVWWSKVKVMETLHSVVTALAHRCSFTQLSIGELNDDIILFSFWLQSEP